MNRIFITGDTHASIDVRKFNSKNFPDGNDLSKRDCVIICGDFGFIWSNIENKEEKYWLNWLESKPWTTLFIDGNHENHVRLNKFKVEDWKGGNIHKIRNSVIHLMRGQVFDLGNRKFFTMGGADSIDKVRRVEGMSWWKEEIPNNREFNTAIENLEKHDYNVDYIITHCAPLFIEKNLYADAENNPITKFLESIVYNVVSYDKWYCGHYHLDKMLDKKIRCVYDNIIEISKGEDDDI